MKYEQLSSFFWVLLMSVVVLVMQLHIHLEFCVLATKNANCQCGLLLIEKSSKIYLKKNANEIKI